MITIYLLASHSLLVHFPSMDNPCLHFRHFGADLTHYRFSIPFLFEMSTNLGPPSNDIDPPPI